MITRHFARNIGIDDKTHLNIVLVITIIRTNTRLVLIYFTNIFSIYYRVVIKPHGQLVIVSSMPYSTYTPILSTS